jgi:hypothetical protein
MVNPASNGAPGASGNSPAPGYILKLVLFFELFMFYTVLIMNTSPCHVITFSLHHTSSLCTWINAKLFNIQWSHLTKFNRNKLHVTIFTIHRYNTWIMYIGTTREKWHYDSYAALWPGSLVTEPTWFVLDCLWKNLWLVSRSLHSAHAHHAKVHRFNSLLRVDCREKPTAGCLGYKKALMGWGGAGD